eukprot:2176217-Pleurochrysis_carterae.AAC.1
MNYTMPTVSINEARHIVKENPSTTYLVMAVIVITSSQPSTQARIADAWRRLSNGLRYTSSPPRQWLCHATCHTESQYAALCCCSLQRLATETPHRQIAS